MELSLPVSRFFKVAFPNFISSSPKGAPWDDAFPDLFGEPYPIIVLQEIIDGFFYLLAFLIALEICLKLWPLISWKDHP